MWLLLLVFLCGFLVGKGLKVRSLSKRMGKGLATVGLFVLLFAMGVRLGREKLLWTELSSFGLSALFLALATGSGAAVFARFAEKVISARRKK